MKLTEFFEDVYYESIGLKELNDLNNALNKIIQFNKHLIERTIEDDEKLINVLIENADNVAHSLFKLKRPVKVRETNFNLLEHKIFDIIEKLNAMKYENSANNGQYANLIKHTEEAVSNFLVSVGNDFVESGFSTTHCFLNDKGKEIPVKQNHFNLNFYKSAYKNFIKQKSKQKSTISELRTA